MGVGRRLHRRVIAGRRAWVGRRPGRWTGRLLALVAGAAMPLALPPVGAWWLGLVGLAPLVLVLRAAGSGWEAAVRGLLGGMGFFAVMFWWLLSYSGWFTALVLPALGLLWVPWAWVAWRVLRPPSTPLRAAAALLAVPSSWVVTEYVRAWDRFAGPWGLLGTTQWQVGGLLPLAAVGGVWLLSLLLALTGVAAGLAVAPGAPRSVRLVGVVAAGGALVAGVLGARAVPAPQIAGSLRVAGVHPGVVSDPDERVAVQADLTAAIDAGVDLVAWGQLSAPFDPGSRPDVVAQLRHAAAAADAPLLVNVDERRPDGGLYRTAVLVGSDGLGQRDAKMRLVPFGEYIPLRGVFGWVADRTQAAATDIQRGGDLAVFDVAGAAIGPLISYESLFPDMRRNLAARGAQATVVQGSLTSFQGTWAHAQQASVEAVRAVESGRSAWLATVSGTSAAFDPVGRPLLWLGPDEVGVYVLDLPLARGRTPYVRFGDWVPATACVLLLAVALPGVVARLRQSRGTTGT